MKQASVEAHPWASTLISRAEMRMSVLRLISRLPREEAADFLCGVADECRNFEISDVVEVLNSPMEVNHFPMEPKVVTKEELRTKVEASAPRPLSPKSNEPYHPKKSNEPLPRASRGERQEEIVSALRKGPCLTSELIDRLGIDASKGKEEKQKDHRIRVALFFLQKKGVIQRSSGGTWSASGRTPKA